MKVTPQRLEIMRYLDHNRNHPTADDIYSALKKANPSLSKTTIYNTLDSLKDHGLIQAVGISGNEMRYDFKRDMHHHFLCKECGDIFDIDVACSFLDQTLKGEHRVDEVHGYFKGVCKDCLSKQRASS
jgi:Fe2+ or Zn2+ uptake regulation protein